MFSKNVISKVDPYAISDMEFNIKKASKHTTIKSLVGTLIIFTLTILISLDNLQNLWMERKDLPTSRLDQLRKPMNPFSDSPICFENNDPLISGKPEILATDSYNQTIQPLTSEQVSQNFPYMIDKMSSSNFECFNLKGIQLFTEIENWTQFSVNMITTVHIKLLSDSEVIQQQEPQILSFVLDFATTYTNKALIMLFPLSRFVLKDQLATSYEPEILTGIGTSGYLSNSVSFNILTRPYTTEVLILRDIAASSVSKENVIQYTVTREGFAQVLGKFFAWYSLFLLVFLTIINPMVDFSLNIELAKTLYSHDALNDVEASIFLQIKYYFSFICRKCFQERIFQAAFTKLEEDMNLMNLLKKQFLMKRISKELRYSDDEIELFIPDFQKKGNRDQQLLEKQEQSQSEDEQANSLKRAQIQIQKEENPQNYIRILIDAILEALDLSEVEVGLVYNKGNQIGSIWSLITSLFAVGGLLGVMIFIGIFTLDTENSYFTETTGNGLTANTTYSLKRHEFLLSIKEVSSSTFDFKFYLTDKDLNPVSEVRMNKGSSCSDLAEAFDITPEQFHYCLPQNQEIQLYTTGSNFNYFHVFGISTSTFLSSPISTLYLKQGYFTQDLISIQAKPFRINMGVTELSVYKLNSIEFTNQPENEIIDTVYSFGVADYQRDARSNGTSLKLNENTKSMVRSSSSIWDIIDNTWGIVILVFEIFIVKICKYLNSLVRKNQSDWEREKERSNIINILSNHDRLINGCFKKQLSSLRYFFKQNLTIGEIGN